MVIADKDKITFNLTTGEYIDSQVRGVSRKGDDDYIIFDFGRQIRVSELRSVSVGAKELAVKGNSLKDLPVILEDPNEDDGETHPEGPEVWDIFVKPNAKEVVAAPAVDASALRYRKIGVGTANEQYENNLTLEAQRMKDLHDYLHAQRGDDDVDAPVARVAKGHRRGHRADVDGHRVDADGHRVDGEDRLTDSEKAQRVAVEDRSTPEKDMLLTETKVNPEDRLITFTRVTPATDSRTSNDSANSRHKLVDKPGNTNPPESPPNDSIANPFIAGEQPQPRK